MMKVKIDSFKSNEAYLENNKLITSFSEFIEYVKFLQENYYDEDCWYRGQPNESYNLVPGIHRINDFEPKDAEDLKTSFILRAKSYGIKNDYSNIWDWYQLMQHHGIPTRLLDWTEGYLIALYFAVRNTKEKINPAVWVLPPYTFNEISCGDDSVFYTDKVTRDTDDIIVDKYINDIDIKLPNNPICIYPAHLNLRMQSQRSCFTVHGKIKDGILEMANKSNSLKLAKLVINSNSIAKIKADLFSSGIAESTLFPDLDGLARELKYDFGID